MLPYAEVRSEFGGTWVLQSVDCANGTQIAVKQDAGKERNMGSEVRYIIGGRGEAGATWDGDRLTLRRSMEVVTAGKPVRMQAEVAWSFYEDPKAGRLLMIKVAVRAPEGKRNFQFHYRREKQDAAR